MSHYFLFKKDKNFTLIFPNILTHFLVISAPASSVLSQSFFPFFVRENQKIDAAAQPIIIPVMSLSIPPIPCFTVFLLFLNIIETLYCIRNYEAILLIRTF